MRHIPLLTELNQNQPPPATKIPPLTGLGIRKTPRLPNRQSKIELIAAAAAKELNELRERWLNPHEWTVEKILEFPGSLTGPWSRYLDKSTLREGASLRARRRA